MSFSTQRTRPNFLSSDGKRGSFRGKPPPYGVPHYIWVTAGVSTASIVYCYFAYLEEVPISHRKRWIATSPKLEKQLGDQEYQQLMRRFRKDVLPRNHPASRTVERVGSRIATASLDFAKMHNLKTYSTAPYTYTVVRSEMANAFVLPGNHVFVMTGLFRYVRDEDELAGVLGHEVAHNLARHAGEKISGSIVVNMLARLSFLVDPTGLLIAVLLPAATLFRELPHSRTQETEADQIGVHLAAMACFDPRASKRVFSAMKADEGGGAHGREPPEFLSTHPSHQSRISNFDKWLPDAVQIFEADAGARCRTIRQQMEQARRAAAQQATYASGAPKQLRDPYHD